MWYISLSKSSITVAHVVANVIVLNPVKVPVVY